MLDLLLILVVLLLIFGGGKLREAGSDLGAAMKGARRLLRGRQAPPAARQPPTGEPDAVFPEQLGPEAAAARQEQRRG